MTTAHCDCCFRVP